MKSRFGERGWTLPSSLIFRCGCSPLLLKNHKTNRYPSICQLPLLLYPIHSQYFNNFTGAYLSSYCMRRRPRGLEPCNYPSTTNGTHGYEWQWSPRGLRARAKCYGDYARWAEGTEEGSTSVSRELPEIGRSWERVLPKGGGIMKLTDFTGRGMADHHRNLGLGSRR